MHRIPGFTAIIFFLAFLLLIDFYVFSGVRTLTTGYTARTRKIIHWSYWIVSGSLYLWFFLLYFLVTFDKLIPRPAMAFIVTWVLFFIPKLVFVFFLLGEDVYRLLRSIVVYFRNLFLPGDKIAIYESRRKFVSTIGLAVAAIPFLGILHGMTIGKFNYRLRREKLFFPDLPEAFDGFTITQISDIHVGSFDPVSDRAEIVRAVQMANDERSDLFVFTGDLVNNVAFEMNGWMNEFSKLRAPYGQISILGNHDYADYVHWDSDVAKEANMQELYSKHAQLGFKLLRNENVYIEKDGQKLFILGVENWGAGGFTKKGDLDKALENVPADAFKILLSHDPSHFDKIVWKHPTHVHLTLSGHTHGAQFGVEIPWLKWSPIQYKYPHWAGLYSTNGKYLYVNRGFGFLAMPARVGIWPEITVFTLRKG
ncbi:MAG: metallophosphoesterase [Bacteroidetes bacterium]|nr:metallophosphoesterase [Bacteroidota bacterium]